MLRWCSSFIMDHSGDSQICHQRDLYRTEWLHNENMWQTWESLKMYWRMFCCLQHSPVSWKGHIDLHVPTRRTLTAITYQDKILTPVFRPYPAARGAGFLMPWSSSDPSGEHRWCRGSLISQKGIDPLISEITDAILSSLLQRHTL